MKRKWEAGQVQEMYSCYLLSGSLETAGRAYGIKPCFVRVLFRRYSLTLNRRRVDACHMAAIGSLGGRKTSQDRQHMQKIGRRGGKARAEQYAKERQP